jgi:hypothetical protein
MKLMLLNAQISGLGIKEESNTEHEGQKIFPTIENAIERIGRSRLGYFDRFSGWD